VLYRKAPNNAKLALGDDDMVNAWLIGKLSNLAIRGI